MCDGRETAYHVLCLANDILYPLLRCLHFCPLQGSLLQERLLFFCCRHTQWRSCSRWSTFREIALRTSSPAPFSPCSPHHITSLPRSSGNSSWRWSRLSSEDLPLRCRCTSARTASAETPSSAAAADDPCPGCCAIDAASCTLARFSRAASFRRRRSSRVPLMRLSVPPLCCPPPDVWRDGIVVLCLADVGRLHCSSQRPSSCILTLLPPR